MISWLVLVLILFTLSLTLLGATYFGRQGEPASPRVRKDHVMVYDSQAQVWRSVYAPDDYKTRTNLLGNY